MLLEREEGRQREREKHPCKRETSVGRLPSFLYTPRPNWGLDPQPVLCALTRNQIPNLSIYETELQPTEPHWPGSKRGAVLFRGGNKRFLFISYLRVLFEESYKSHLYWTTCFCHCCRLFLTSRITSRRTNTVITQVSRAVGIGGAEMDGKTRLW